MAMDCTPLTQPTFSITILAQAWQRVEIDFASNSHQRLCLLLKISKSSKLDNDTLTTFIFSDLILHTSLGISAQVNLHWRSVPVLSLMC